MKIELITKKEYYDILGDNNTDYFFINCNISDKYIIYPYRKIKGTNIIFSILDDSSKLAIPKIFEGKFDVNKLKSSIEGLKSFSYDNWELLLEEKLDKIPYFLNAFKRKDIDGSIHGECYEQGKYVIHNYQTGEKFEFYLRTIDTYFSEESSICNDFLLDINNSNYDKSLLLYLIKEILNKNGRNYKRANLESK